MTDPKKKPKRSASGLYGSRKEARNVAKAYNPKVKKEGGVKMKRTGVGVVKKEGEFRPTATYKPVVKKSKSPKLKKMESKFSGNYVSDRSYKGKASKSVKKRRTK